MYLGSPAFHLFCEWTTQHVILQMTHNNFWSAWARNEEDAILEPILTSTLIAPYW